MINKYLVYGLIIAVAISVGSFVLRRATEKEQTNQTTTVTVAAGGIANISSAQTSPDKKEKLGIGVYTEYDAGDKAITIGISYQF